MSRSVFVAVSAVVMLVLALVVVRLFRDPAPVATTPIVASATASGEASPEAPSVSAPLNQDAPPALPPASALVMTTGNKAPEAAASNSAASPLGNGEMLPISDAAPVSGDAPDQSATLARDSKATAALVTEPPKAAPAATPKEAPMDVVKETPKAPAEKSAEKPADKTPAKAVEATKPAEVVKPAEPEKAVEPVKPADKPAEPVKPAGKPAEPVKPAEVKADKADKAGILVTKSSLTAKAGVATVVAATLSMDGTVVTLRLEGSQALSAKTFILKGPDRVVLDLAGKWAMETPRVGSNRMVGALRVGNQAEATRVVLDMKVAPGKASVSQISPNVVELTIR